MLKTHTVVPWASALALAALLSCGTATPPSQEPAEPVARQYLNVGEKPNGFTHTVVAPPGTMVFVSGAAGAGPDGEMPADFAAQADNTFKSLGERLALAGADFEDVVKLTYFINDTANISILREVRARYLNMENPPAASAIPVAFKGEMLLEVEAIAILDE